MGAVVFFIRFLSVPPIELPITPGNSDIHGNTPGAKPQTKWTFSMQAERLIICWDGRNTSKYITIPNINTNTNVLYAAVK